MKTVGTMGLCQVWSGQQGGSESQHRRQRREWKMRKDSSPIGWIKTGCSSLHTKQSEKEKERQMFLFFQPLTDLEASSSNLIDSMSMSVCLCVCCV